VQGGLPELVAADSLGANEQEGGIFIGAPDNEPDERSNCSFLHLNIVQLAFIPIIFSNLPCFISSWKKSIQLQVPLRLPLYDFAPITEETLVP